MDKNPKASSDACYGWLWIFFRRIFVKFWAVGQIRQILTRVFLSVTSKQLWLSTNFFVTSRVHCYPMSRMVGQDSIRPEAYSSTAEAIMA